MLIKVNHDELIRDYGGYEFIQEEMEAALQRFLQLYGQDVLRVYGYPESLQINELQVQAAGAGASKFVFGVSVIGQDCQLAFGIRLYSNIIKSVDTNKIYQSADEYRSELETYDGKLLATLIDEINIYREFQEAANSGIEIKGIWTRFPLSKEVPSFDSIRCNFFYMEDRELKRLLANLGFNALTIGDFVVGYDGRKILARSEFELQRKLNAIIQICHTMLQSWLFTTRYNDQRQIVGRTIVDLKPAQFVVQSEEVREARWMPAVVIDVGPAENTDAIFTYLKDVGYMKELIPAFAGEMLKKLALPEADRHSLKQQVWEAIIAYLNQCKQGGRWPKQISQETFVQLLEEFIGSMSAKLVS
jgi:hypothetical protein